jgi:hypothetical protein
VCGTSCEVSLTRPTLRPPVWDGLFLFAPEPRLSNAVCWRWQIHPCVSGLAAIGRRLSHWEAIRGARKQNVGAQSQDRLSIFS